MTSITQFVVSVYFQQQLITHFEPLSYFKNKYLLLYTASDPAHTRSSLASRELLFELVFWEIVCLCIFHPPCFKPPQCTTRVPLGVHPEARLLPATSWRVEQERGKQQGLGGLSLCGVGVRGVNAACSLLRLMKSIESSSIRVTQIWVPVSYYSSYPNWHIPLAPPCSFYIWTGIDSNARALVRASNERWVYSGLAFWKFWWPGRARSWFTVITAHLWPLSWFRSSQFWRTDVLCAVHTDTKYNHRVILPVQHLFRCNFQHVMRKGGFGCSCVLATCCNQI